MNERDALERIRAEDTGMKRFGRVLLNWLLILTSPVWFLPVFTLLALHSVYSGGMDRREVVEAFVTGRRLFWH